jgi:putative endopeptidase
MQKIGDLYLSGMDSAALETMGDQPIRPDLDRIASITDTKGILKEVAYERSHGIASPLIGFLWDRTGKMSASIFPRWHKVVLHFRIAIIT